MIVIRGEGLGNRCLLSIDLLLFALSFPRFLHDEEEVPFSLLSSSYGWPLESNLSKADVETQKASV